MRASLALRRIGTATKLPPQGHSWKGFGPFIYIGHHVDQYPAGKEDLAPDPALLNGRILGNDFHNPAGWSMYMGTRVPGFPAHPHKGIETLTLCKRIGNVLTPVRRGIVDHSDSTGAGARYGAGDVQWVTAGKGVRHSEMFPLFKGDNTLDMYQLWLNLTAEDKKAGPEFVMMWKEQVPVIRTGSPGHEARVTVVAGAYGDANPLKPPKASWAARSVSDMVVWFVELDPGATVTLPPTNTPETKRQLYIHGEGVTLDIVSEGETERVSEPVAFVPQDGRALEVVNGAKPARILVLQAVDIGEPVAIRGPFVMNTEQENLDGFAEYRKTKFGTWKWDTDAPTWGPDLPRFAQKADGVKVYPPGEQ